MIQTNVALVRHGDYQQKSDTPSAWQPFPLTESGAEEVRFQARQLGELLKEKVWTLDPQVHSSPLLRAWQTAQIFISELTPFFDSEPQHTEFPALSERSVGSVANLTISEIEQLLQTDPRYAPAPPGWKSDSHYRLPFMGAESLHQAGQRVAQHIEQHLPEKATQLKLFIGHGAAIRHAACHLNVINICEVPRLSMYHGHPIILSKSTEGWQHIAGQWKQRNKDSAITD